MKSWLAEQYKSKASQFDAEVISRYPDSQKIFSDPHEFYKGLVGEWNYLDAVKALDWDKYIKKDAVIIDIGGGTGWLSAYISSFEQVKEISLIDSSRFFLEKMVPEMIKLMKGVPEKIKIVEGLFSPLLLDDESIDVAFICSSMHHADNISKLLIEIKRVLKKGGYLFILNETPYNNFSYLGAIIKQFLIIVRDIIFHRFKAVSTSIASNGFLYDPYLNDKAYPFWYWEKAIKESGFLLADVVNTGLSTLKQKKGIMLRHFICRKN
ncbi:MAG: class I SAM-dependent methyltransferase [PVC group bacterium]|nr:class I SAM-dependent methyltransferase [PVC group bacterium]